MGCGQQRATPPIAKKYSGRNTLMLKLYFSGGSKKAVHGQSQSALLPAESALLSIEAVCKVCGATGLWATPDVLLLVHQPAVEKLTYKELK